VFLVLGGDPRRPGAKRWASETSNLLNVAVCRAHRRLYVGGDRESWCGYPFFDHVADRLPTVAVPGRRPPEPSWYGRSHRARRTASMPALTSRARTGGTRGWRSR
jgi:hypothetical protein